MDSTMNWQSQIWLSDLHFHFFFFFAVSNQSSWADPEHWPSAGLPGVTVRWFALWAHWRESKYNCNKVFFAWQLHAIRIVASQLGNSVQGRLVNKMGSHSRSVQGMALKLQWFNDDSIWVLIRSSGFVWFIWAILLGYAIITTTIIITIPFCKLQVKKLMCIKKLIFFFFFRVRSLKNWRGLNPSYRSLTGTLNSCLALASLS